MGKTTMKMNDKNIKTLLSFVCVNEIIPSFDFDEGKLRKKEGENE